MTRKSYLAAALAALVGAGLTYEVQGAAAPPTVSVQRLVIFECADEAGAPGLCLEVCGKAATEQDGAEVIVDQGCESASVPAAAADQAEALRIRALAWWKTKRGL